MYCPFCNRESESPQDADAHTIAMASTWLALVIIAVVCSAIVVFGSLKSIPSCEKSRIVVFDVEKWAHSRTPILPYPFKLLPAGAVCFDMHAVRLMGGVVADQVMGENDFRHGDNARVQRHQLNGKPYL